MIYVIIFFAICAGLVWHGIVNLTRNSPAKTVTSKRPNPQLDATLRYAARLYDEKKYLTAEKAYLEAIKYDHKNVVAYTRLGKIYHALKNYPDAIECCQIAAQIAPGSHTYFNLGTAYYDNKNFIKAIAAFEKAIIFEPSAGRYLALGRAHQRLSNWPKAVSAFEKAVALDNNKHNLQILLEAYRGSNNLDKAKQIQQQLAKAGDTATSGVT